MAQSTAAPSESHSIPSDTDLSGSASASVEVRNEQLDHTRRILDLQIEGSRAIYRDALGIFLVNILALVALFAAGLYVTAMGGLTGTTTMQISVVLFGFGTFSLFISMAYATRAYLGDIADYSRPVTNTDDGTFADKTISRNISIIKRNAQIMEAKVEGIRTAMLSMVGGFGVLFLALGFQLIPLDSWAQALVSLNALVVIGFLLVKVMGIDYLESKKDQLLR